VSDVEYQSSARRWARLPRPPSNPPGCTKRTHRSHLSQNCVTAPENFLSPILCNNFASSSCLYSWPSPLYWSRKRAGASASDQLRVSGSSRLHLGTQIRAGPVQGQGSVGARSEGFSCRGGGRTKHTPEAEVCLFTPPPPAPPVTAGASRLANDPCKEKRNQPAPREWRELPIGFARPELNAPPAPQPIADRTMPEKRNEPNTGKTNFQQSLLSAPDTVLRRHSITRDSIGAPAIPAGASKWRRAWPAIRNAKGTGLCDRRNDDISAGEVESIRI